MSTSLPMPAMQRLAALDGLPVILPAAREWACELRDQPVGWSAAALPAGWREALSHAGVPLAAASDPIPLTIAPEATALRLRDDGSIEVPALERFRTLTSLPLKPLRQAVALRFAVRLQVGAGVHLRMFRSCLVLINAAPSHRGGFLHGPRSGMRTVVALDPDAALVQRW